MKEIASVVIYICIAHCLNAQDKMNPVNITDMLKIKQISSVAISNDGSKAAFMVMAIEPDGVNKWEYKYVNQLFVVPTDGKSSPAQLTYKESASQPAWSPDSKKIAFVRVVDTKPQIFVLSLNGGEAYQLTRYKYGASAPKWSPDGKKILFSSNILLSELLKDSLLNTTSSFPRWSFEKPGFDKNEQWLKPGSSPDPDGNIEQVRAYLSNNAADKKAKIINKLNFQEEANVSADISFNHFFIINTEPGATPVSVTNGFYSFNDASFTPNGKHLVITGVVDSTQHPDRSLQNQVFISDTAGGNIRLLLGEKGRNFSNVRISPTGKWLAFQYGNTFSVTIPSLAIMPIDGTSKEIVTIPFDRNKNDVTWSKDEKFIYFTAQSNGGQPLFRADVKTRTVKQLSDVNSGITSFNLNDDKLVFVKTEPSNPFELYLSDPSFTNPLRISSFNLDWLKSKKLSMPEKKSFTNNKGYVVDYWVMKPSNFEPGKKYPLLLEMHGGPSAMWGPGESSMWHEFQFFCSKGYGIVYCNPRGSGGYGLDFLRGNINDWGAGPASDVLTALDSAAAQGWADTSRLAITGGSYAGYLVAWILGHSSRFKAACAQRGVYDLATFFGEGNAWRLVPYYFGGYPWEPATKSILDRESPISYVENITTPFIIFHGESDLRTGVIQSEMLYKSLKVLGRPVEYVRHPGGTHELTRSGNNRQRIDQMLRTYEFFERWLKGK